MSLLKSQLMFLNTSLTESNFFQDKLTDGNSFYISNQSDTSRSLHSDMSLPFVELNERLGDLSFLLSYLENWFDESQDFLDLIKNLYLKSAKIDTDLVFLTQKDNFEFPKVSRRSAGSYSIKNIHSSLPILKLCIFDARTAASKCLVQSIATEDVLKLFSLIRHLDDCRELVDVFALCHIEN